MITDTDIKKLKGVFATKADLKKFATKAEFKELDERTIRIAEKVSEMSIRMDNFATKDDLENGLRETTDVLLTAMDKIARGMDVLKSEYTAVGLQLDRHVSDKNLHSIHS